MKCVRCGKEASIKVLAPLCNECFIISYENRVEKVIKKFRLIEKNDKVLVAVSGGKDSLSCALVLSKLRNKLNFEMEILTMDVNTYCFSNKIKEFVEDFSKRINVKFNFISFKDYFGFNKKLEDWIKERKIKRPVCSVCGILKRYAINKFARENGFNKIATGHCANDIARFFIKNLIGKNLEYISKLKPIVYSEHPKQVTRIRPLYECLEFENLNYVKLNNLNPISSCSFYMMKDRFYRIISLIEEKDRKFLIEFVRGLEELNFETRKEKIFECRICGEPTNKEVCSVCRLLNKE
ncbi:MAG: ATP-binding protein [Candidatus Aenigmatarchaeota archaeon]